jgi:hypothetical protein
VQHQQQQHPVDVDGNEVMYAAAAAAAATREKKII